MRVECIDLLLLPQDSSSRRRVMPYCVAYGCDNDTHDAPCEVSFHHLLLKKPALLSEMHGIVGRAWCYDRWYVYTYTTDDLTCNNKHNSYIVHSQCTSNSTASQWYLRNLYWYVMKAGI